MVQGLLLSGSFSAHVPQTVQAQCSVGLMQIDPGDMSIDLRAGLWILPSALTGAVDLLDRSREILWQKAFPRPMFLFSDVTFSGWPTAIWHGFLSAGMLQAWFPMHAEAR